MRRTLQHYLSRLVDVHRLADGLVNRDRVSLSKSITLIESTLHEHRILGAELMHEINLLLKDRLKHEQNSQIEVKQSFRIGIAGPPGVGKSTFVERIGTLLVEEGSKVAVIPVDPSSHISGGSILGDKTRMDILSRSSNAYIRASPTRGVLGGIAEHTTDVIYLCESAGYNMILVESVGLGQSEVDMDLVVDMLIVLIPPSGGDGLQASKKGIMEAADMVVVNKADGSLLQSAQHTQADYSAAMRFIRQKNKDWLPPVLLLSASTGYNVPQLMENIKNYQNFMIKNGSLQQKRSNQLKQSMESHFRRLIIAKYENNKNYVSLKKKWFHELDQGVITSRLAAIKMYQELQNISNEKS